MTDEYTRCSLLVSKLQSVCQQRKCVSILLTYFSFEGWGLDDPDLIKEAVTVMHTHLKSEGILVVGHNRGRGTCCSFSPLFTPHSFGDLPSVHEDPESETKHVYEFFIKNS